MSYKVNDPCWVVVKGDPASDGDHLGACQLKGIVKAVNADGTVDVHRPAASLSFAKIRPAPKPEDYSSKEAHDAAKAAWPTPDDYYEEAGPSYPAIPLIKGLRYIPKDGDSAVHAEAKAEVKNEGDGTCLVCEYDQNFRESPGFADMCDMSKLNDAELCRNIKMAFDHKPAPCSFIWCGATLVAINTMAHRGLYGPGKPLANVYSKTTMETYCNMSNRQAVPPHSYALATDCFRALFEPAKGKSACSNQAILITGESGAGKTYTTKKVLDYVAYLAGGKDAAKGEMKITDKMLATTPILEGWGNGNMPRNPDSSRFGKLYKIYFSKETQEITGCEIDIYMLEKSRLASQQMNERNFHILYRMLADLKEADSGQMKDLKKQHDDDGFANMIIWNKDGSGARVDTSVDGAEGMMGFDPTLKEAVGFNRANWGGTDTLKDYEYFNYLNGGSTMLALHPIDPSHPAGYNRIYGDVPQGWKAADRVESCCQQGGREYEDQMHMSATVWALEQFFTKEQVELVFRVTAASLWLGNIEYDGEEDMGCQVLVNDPKTKEALAQVARLLQIDHAALIKAMHFNKVQQAPPKPPLEVARPTSEARTFRDSMARNLYDSIFLWLIKTCSENLLATTKKYKLNDAYIGVLDIFGFEFYEDQKLRPAGSEVVNGMDQFCINMCNEVLQNKFIQVIFKAEQALYMRQLHHEIDIDLGDLENEDTVGFLKGSEFPNSNNNNVPKMIFNIQTKGSVATRVGHKADDALKKEIVKQKKNYPNRLSYPKSNGSKPYPSGPYGVYQEPGQKRATNKINQVQQEAGGGKGSGFDPCFRLQHYAANVSYDVRGWIDKDADKLTDFVKDMLAASGEPLFIAPTYQKMVSSGGSTQGVMALFASKLNLLIDTLSYCDCHFVRCIKASNPPAQGVFEPGLVVNQLAYTGMLSTLVIRRLGYPKRLPFQDFYDTFKLLPEANDHAAVGSMKGEDGDAALLVEWLRAGKAAAVYDKMVEGMSEQVREAFVPISQRGEAIEAGTPSDPDKEQPLIFMRDWLYRELEAEALEVKKESGNMIQTIFRAKDSLDSYKAKRENSLKLAPVLRSLIAKARYLNDKYTHLDITGRMELHRVLRGHLSRSEYMRKRSGHYEQENRHRAQDLMYATLMRQKFYNAKLKANEVSLIEAENRKMREQEQLAKQHMADRNAQKLEESEERKAMRAEDQYAADIHAAKLAEKYGVEKEGCLLKASHARQRAAMAVARVHNIEVEADQRMFLLEQHKEVIEKELKSKCLEAFKKMNLITGQSFRKPGLIKLPPDQDSQGLQKYFAIVARDRNSTKFALAKSSFDTVVDPKSFDGQQKTKLALKLGSLLGCDPHKVMVQLTPRDMPMPTPRLPGTRGYGQPFSRPSN